MSAETGFSPEEYDAAMAAAYNEGLAAAMQYGQPEQYEQYEQPQEQEFPQIEDPEIQAQVDAYLEAKFSERLGSLEPVIGMIADQYGDQETEQYLTALEPHIGGAFDHDRAASIAADMEEAGLAPEQALQQAAQLQYQFEQELLQRGATEYQERIKAAQSAPAEPGVTGAASAPASTEPPGWDEIGDRWLGQRSPVEVGG